MNIKVYDGDESSIKKLLAKNGVFVTSSYDDVNVNCGNFRYVVLFFNSITHLLSAKDVLFKNGYSFV